MRVAKPEEGSFLKRLVLVALLAGGGFATCYQVRREQAAQALEASSTKAAPTFEQVGALHVATPPLVHYRAKLSALDHINSKGKILEAAEDVLLQDRVNVNGLDRRDEEDEVDTVYTSRTARGNLARLLRAPGSIDDRVRREIERSDPTVDVTIWKDRVSVETVNDGVALQGCEGTCLRMARCGSVGFSNRVDCEDTCTESENEEATRIGWACWVHAYTCALLADCDQGG